MGQLFCCFQEGESLQVIEESRILIYKTFLKYIALAKTRYLHNRENIQTQYNDKSIIEFCQYIMRYVPNVEHTENVYCADMALLGKRPVDVVKVLAKTDLQLAVDVAFAHLIGRATKTRLDYHKAIALVQSSNESVPRENKDHTIKILEMHMQAQMASIYDEFERRIRPYTTRQNTRPKVSDNVFVSM